MIPLKKWFRSPGRDPGPAGEARIRVEPRIPGSNGAPPPERRSSVSDPKGSGARRAGRGSDEAVQPDPMDRPLDPAFRRRRRIRQIARSLAGLAALVSLFVWLPGWIRPSVDSGRIRTAQVQRGAVEETITASGTVVPRFEQILFSPVNTRLVRILHKPGDLLRQGEAIVELDLNAARLEVEKRAEELALKQNQRTRIELEERKNLSDLETSRRLKKLDQERRQTRTAQYLELQRIGAVSGEQLRQAQLEEERAGIELQQLEENRRNLIESTRARLQALQLEMKTLEREGEEVRRRLERAHIRADREGVLTSVSPVVGAPVGQGQEIARVADLSSFRVDVRVSDIHAQRLRTGLPVRLRIREEAYVEGRISRILPTVDDNVIDLEVELDDPAHPLLRPNQRVDAYIVTARKERSLRLARGPFINGGAGLHEVFVVHGETAVKTEVRIGLANFEYYEVVEGLLEGDEVIISSMKNYLHMDEVRIR